MLKNIGVVTPFLISTKLINLIVIKYTIFSLVVKAYFQIFLAAGFEVARSAKYGIIKDVKNGPVFS